MMVLVPHVAHDNQAVFQTASGSQPVGYVCSPSMVHYDQDMCGKPSYRDGSTHVDDTRHRQ